MTDQELIDAARQAAQHSYSPYSKFPVGAALRFADGSIVTGTNIENASYGLALCAETVAVSKAMADGARKNRDGRSEMRRDRRAAALRTSLDFPYRRLIICLHPIYGCDFRPRRLRPACLPLSPPFLLFADAPTPWPGLCAAPLAVLRAGSPAAVAPPGTRVASGLCPPTNSS